MYFIIVRGGDGRFIVHLRETTTGETGTVIMQQS